MGAEALLTKMGSLAYGLLMESIMVDSLQRHLYNSFRHPHSCPLGVGSLFTFAWVLGIEIPLTVCMANDKCLSLQSSLTHLTALPSF